MTVVYIFFAIFFATFFFALLAFLWEILKPNK